MKKIQTYVMLSISLLFITANVYLIEKADSKITRTNYVEEWKGTKTSNIKKQIVKTGVIAPEDEIDIYFDRVGNRSFKGFLVKEGDTVEIGTPLFNYEVEDSALEASLLESGIQQSEDEINSIEDHIDDLDNLKPAPSLSSFTNTDEEDNEDKSIEASNLEIEASIEQEISAQELEISRLESKIDHMERQLADLEAEETTISVLSEVEGVVKNISDELNNPLIVIVSNTRIGEGTLNEMETFEVAEGQSVEISFAGIKDKLLGTISTISELPIEEPSTERLSEYPFKVDLEDNQEKLLPGYHVTMSITTKEAKDVLTISQEHILTDGPQEKYLLILTNDGIVEKRKIETGLSVDGRVEVTKGLEKGETYVTKPLSFIEDEAEFVTPLHLGELSWKDIKSSDQQTILKNMLLGILER